MNSHGLRSLYIVREYIVVLPQRLWYSLVYQM